MMSMIGNVDIQLTTPTGGKIDDFVINTVRIIKRTNAKKFMHIV